MPRAMVSAIAAICVVAATGEAAVAQVRPESSPPFRIGASFERALAGDQSVVWKNVPIREAVARLGRASGVCILLDRRVDPQARVDLQAESASLEQLLRRLADENGWSVATVAPVVVLGPTEATARLRTLAAMRRDALNQMSPSVRSKLRSAEATQWELLATPREILGEMVRRHDLRWVNLEMLPHDLWPAGGLPPMALSDRIVLVTSQFDLTYEASDEGRLALVPLPERVAVVRPFPIRSERAADLARWESEVPDAEFRVSAGRLWVRGRVEAIHRVREILQGTGEHREEAPRSTERTLDAAELARQRLTLRVQQKPLRAVIDLLERELDLTFSTSGHAEANAVDLEHRVIFDVEQATVDELLEAMLGPIGLDFRREGHAVEILAD